MDTEQVSMSGDTPDDYNDDQEKIDVGAWINKINKARDKEDSWRTRAKKCIKIYRDEPQMTSTSGRSGSAEKSTMSYNILWANTETLLPVLFSSVPKPDVRNRHLDQDDVADMAAEVLEKSLSYLWDKNNSERIVKAGIKDHLLTGRYVPRVRLEAIKEMQDVETLDMEGNVIITQEEVEKEQNPLIENVAYDQFTVEPCKTWEEVTWVEFPHMLSKDKYKKYFPESRLPAGKQDDQYYTEMTYEVHEVWDKEKKRVFFIADGVETPLKVMGDPLGLEDFWPIPRPLYSIETSDTLVPIPEYIIYQEQARELDAISYRITDLVRACKFIGIYDGTQTNLAGLLKSRDSQFTAVTSNLLREVGLRGVLDVVDVSPIARVLQQLYVQRDQIKAVIYEITGLSDILRGETEASESATAQTLKSRNASIRLRDRRANINKMIVELLRIQAQLIGKFCQEKQLEEMSGIKLDYSQDPMPPMPQPPMQVPPMQNPNMPIDPNYMANIQGQMQQYDMAMSEYQMEMDKRQKAEAVMELLRNDVLRQYNIDIETDSTILADMEMEGQKRAALVASITQFIATTAPLVQSGAMPLETAKALLNYAVNTTKISRELEDALDLIGKGQPQMMPPMGMPPQMPQGMPPEMSAPPPQMPPPAIEDQAMQGLAL